MRAAAARTARIAGTFRTTAAAIRPAGRFLHSSYVAFRWELEAYLSRSSFPRSVFLYCDDTLTTFSIASGIVRFYDTSGPAAGVRQCHPNNIFKIKTTTIIMGD